MSGRERRAGRAGRRRGDPIPETAPEAAFALHRLEGLLGSPLASFAPGRLERAMGRARHDGGLGAAVLRARGSSGRSSVVRVRGAAGPAGAPPDSEVVLGIRAIAGDPAGAPARFLVVDADLGDVLAGWRASFARRGAALVLRDPIGAALAPRPGGQGGAESVRVVSFTGPLAGFTAEARIAPTADVIRSIDRQAALLIGALAAAAIAIAGVAALLMRGFARIEVADEGPGIPAGALPRIFEPFLTVRPGAAGLVAVSDPAASAGTLAPGCARLAPAGAKPALGPSPPPRGVTADLGIRSPMRPASAAQVYRKAKHGGRLRSKRSQTCTA